MAARRAITEAVNYDEDSDEVIDLNNLKDEDVQAALEMAYEMDGQDEDEYEGAQDEDDDDEGGGEGNGLEADSDVDDLDFQNFKGIYFGEDPNRKYQCPETGAHFEYFDLCKRMNKMKELRK